MSGTQRRTTQPQSSATNKAPAPAHKRTQKRKRRQGSVYQRGSDNRWVAALPVRDPYTRIQRTATAYADTEPEAERLLAEMIVARDAGLPVGGTGGAVNHFIEKWLSEVVQPSVRPLSLSHYYRDSRLHIWPYFEGYTLREVTPRHIHDWQRALTRKGLCPKSVGRIRGLLGRAFRQAEAWDMVSRNPVSSVRAPRVTERTFTVWTPDEAKKFLQWASATPYHAWYATALYMGLRLGEMLALRWEDVDLEGGVLTVQAQIAGKGPQCGERVPVKSKAGNRRLELPRSLQAILRAHRRAQLVEVELRAAAGLPLRDSGYVFRKRNGERQGYVNAQHLFVKHVPNADVPRIRFHDLRHTAASIMYARGVPIPVISKILGHASVEITMRVYTHLFEQAFVDAAAAMDDAYGLG